VKLPEQLCAADCECSLLEKQLQAKEAENQVLVEALDKIARMGRMSQECPEYWFRAEEALSIYQAQAEARVKQRERELAVIEAAKEYREACYRDYCCFISPPTWEEYQERNLTYQQMKIIQAVEALEEGC
jgi:hypothetical protein